MSKLSARWVPRMLTPEQKLKRVDISRTLLTRFQSDPEDFHRRLVTQDETWVHHFEPRVRVGIVKVIDYIHIEKGSTVNGEYYAPELTRLKAATKQKRSWKLTARVLWMPDNAPVHTAHVAVAEAVKCGFELLQHPPYSPDLAPSDFYLFPKLNHGCPWSPI